MRGKKFLSVFAPVVLMTGMLGACSGAETGSGGTENSGEDVTTISMIYAGGDPASKKAISESVAAFMEENPDIKVQEYPSGTGNYLDFIRTKDAVGEFPDIIEMRDTEMFVDAGKLAELPAEVTDKFESPVEIDGKVYTAPLSGLAPQGIFYNKKLFEKAGIDAPPETYEEFLAAGDKLKAIDVAPLVVGGKDTWHMGFLVNHFLTDHVFAENPDWLAQRNAKEVKWSDPEPVKAMDEMIKLFDGYVNEGFISTADNQTATMLASEQAAMLFSGSWMIAQIMEADPEFELGWFPLPDKEGKVNLTGGGTQEGWAISAEAAKDPEKMEAAQKFMDFFFEKEQYTEYLSSVNGMPATTDEITYAGGEVMETMLTVYNDPEVNKSAMFNQYTGDKRLPTEFRDYYFKVIQEVILGSRNLEDAMADLDKKWDERQAADAK